jgi:C1A family cysteine protease
MATSKRTTAKKGTSRKPSTTKRSTATESGGGRTAMEQFICNVVPSRDTDKDWSYSASIESGAVGAPAALPAAVDLRTGWWAINSQEDTGSCVGWATADGVVRYHMVKAGRIAESALLSPRHVWMASKETDEFTTRPESFMEGAGTSLKAALDIARKHGVALMSDLPFHIQTKMYTGSENAFYAGCAQRRIAAYFNLRRNLGNWKAWLATNGPILAALSVDESWDNAKAKKGKIDTFKPNTVRGGHAICVVGYRADGRFIVRNSWGTGWGDQGFGYVKPAYIADGFFDEAYGVTI